MSAALVVLLAIAGWTALSVLTALVILPLLRASRRSDALLDRAAAHRPRPETSESASALRSSGYLGIVLERLVLHACTTFAADEVCVFGQDRRSRGDGLVLLQGAGVDPELVGRRLTIDWDPMVATLACGRPIAIPGHLWPAWQGGLDAGDDPVQSAAIAPVWFGGRMQGAVSVIHRGEDRGRGIDALGPLGELAELAARVLSHTEGRQLSAADPQPEIDALLATAERTESGSAGRAAEVAATARWLADDLGLGGADLIELELAARLYDVGRLRTPSRAARRDRRAERLGAGAPAPPAAVGSGDGRPHPRARGDRAARAPLSRTLGRKRVTPTAWPASGSRWRAVSSLWRGASRREPRSASARRTGAFDPSSSHGWRRRRSRARARRPDAAL